MTNKPKTRAEREREDRFRLRPGERWHKGARVRCPK